MRITKSLLIICLCLVLSGPAWAQPGGGQGLGPGEGMGGGLRTGRGMGAMRYNPQTVTTIKGTVESLAAPQTRRMRHESLVVKTDQGSITVHLGPAWYMSQNQMIFNPGDAVEVTGSQMQAAGGAILVAKEVTVKGKTLELRDDQGLPLWRGQGRQQPQ